METSLDKNPIPYPNVVENSTSPNRTQQEKRQYNRPRTGVIEVPKITNTPMRDWFEVEMKKNVQKTNKSKPKKNVNLSLQNLLSLSIVFCGLFAGLNIKKNK